MRSFIKIFCLSTAIALTGCSDGTQVFSSNVSGTPKQAAPQTAGYYKIGNPYQVNGVWYYPKEEYTYEEVGIASWYGPDFHNGITANGEQYDMHGLTAAHRTLPLPSVVRVTNLQNNRSLVLRVNDRGPFANNRIIDVSMYAAQMLGFKDQGTTQVRVEILAEESKNIKNDLLKEGKATVAGLESQEALLVGNKQEATTSANSPARPQEVPLGNTPRLANSPTPIPQNAMPLIPSATKPKASEYNDWDEDLSKAQSQRTVSAPKPLAPIPTVKKQENIAKPVTKAKPLTPYEVKAGYYVQVGAFGSLDNANGLKDRVASFGNSLIMPVSVNGKTLYRVRIGPESAKKSLEIMDNITRNGYPDARLVEEKGSSPAGQRLERAF